MENVGALSNKKMFWAQVIKGVLIATSISLVSILIFALIIYVVGVTDKVLMPVNQVIKVLSIFFGCFIGFKGDTQKGLVKGMFVGLLYTVLAYTLFSALSQNFTVNLTILNDLIFGSIIGAICGIIVVNLRK